MSEQSGDSTFREEGRRNRWGEIVGVEIEEWSATRVVGRIQARPDHHQPFGILHGGVYCSIVEDLASRGAGIAAREAGAKGVVGVSNSTDFLRSHGEGELLGVAEPIHIGRSMMIWMVTITRTSDGKTVGRGHVRFHVLNELPQQRADRLASD